MRGKRALLMLSVALALSGTGCAGWPCPGPAAIMAERRAAAAKAAGQSTATEPAPPAPTAPTKRESRPPR